MAMEPGKALIRAQRLIMETIGSYEKHGLVLSFIINRLRQYAAEAGISADSRNAKHVHEKGFWSVGKSTVKTGERIFIESSDGHHDVRLYINGDFGNEAACQAYATEIARRLNLAASVLATEEEQLEESD